MLADTSLFIARESGRNLAQIELPDEMAISVITIGELRAGVLAADDIPTRDLRLATLAEALTFDAVPIDQPVAETWARLRLLLRDAGLRMPVNDAWTAATAKPPVRGLTPPEWRFVRSKTRGKALK